MNYFLFLFYDYFINTIDKDMVSVYLGGETEIQPWVSNKNFKGYIAFLIIT